jgi:hypothetical protein
MNIKRMERDKPVSTIMNISSYRVNVRPVGRLWSDYRILLCVVNRLMDGCLKLLFTNNFNPAMKTSRQPECQFL